MTDRSYDYLLVGGGLQGGLAALAILSRHKKARVALVERGSRLGGNHTWCFHAGDVPEDLLPLLEPLIAHRWPGYEVAFPAYRRALESPYAAVTSARFDRVLQDTFASAPGADLYLGVAASEMSGQRVRLEDGRELEARVVIDARGPDPGSANPGSCAFQKFVGHEIVTRAPHGLERPMLMDATVPQVDGFRFLYVLPLGARRLLVEDTYFSDSPALDRAAVGAEVVAHAEKQGWAIERIERSEQGVLPLPWRGEHPIPEKGPLLAGYRGGWFHPVTGYSFPIALRLAHFFADTPPGDLFGAPLAALARAHRSQRGFAYRLNRMLYRWFAPEDRFRVLERFYRLPEATIRRFYAMRLTRADRARIMIGRPPRGLSLRRVFGHREARP